MNTIPKKLQRLFHRANQIPSPFTVHCSLITIILLTLLTSCGSYRKLTYLQNIKETGSDSVIKPAIPVYHLQPTDILYVKIISQNKDINELFNSEQGNTTTGSYNEIGAYLLNYPIDDSGYINLPVLKKIKVATLTMDKAKSLIEEHAKIYLNDVQVIVRLISFRYTVLGEVKSPGVRIVYDEQVTILEALAGAGDITYNGNRQNVLILRPGNNGTITYRIDLTKGDLVLQPNFYIMPNDIIYVEPLGTTLFRERASDYMFIVTSLSSVLTAILLILNLTK